MLKDANTLSRQPGTDRKKEIEFAVCRSSAGGAQGYKCLAQKLGQVQYFSGLYVELRSYLLAQEANVTPLTPPPPQFKQ